MPDDRLTLKERFQMAIAFSLYAGIVFLEWVGHKLSPPKKHTGPLNYRKPIGDREWNGRPLSSPE
jgi:hypothetical protein